MDFAKQIKTKKGEIVKSNYEKDVANYLFEQGIDYVYEQPLKLSDGFTVHPDFYLPEYDVYIEIYGMWGDQKYNQDRSKKQWAYDQDDIKVIELWFGNGRGSFRYHLERQFEVLVGMPFPKKKSMFTKQSLNHRVRPASKESTFDLLDRLFARFPHLASRLLFILLFLLIIARFYPQSEQKTTLHTVAPQSEVSSQMDAKQPALPALPEPEKQLVQIAKFSNPEHGSYLSEPFTISNAPFKIQYDCKCNNYPTLCSAILVDANTISLKTRITSSKSQNGSTEYKKPGEFRIGGTIYGECSFTVYEYK